MKKYIGLTKKVLWCVLGINIVCFLLALLHYYSNISYTTIGTVLLIFMIGLFFTVGYLGGKKCDNKGFIYGLKYGFIICALLYVIGGILFSFKINLYKLCYYVILILASTFGSMLGINRKK